MALLWLLAPEFSWGAICTTFVEACARECEYVQGGVRKFGFAIIRISAFLLFALHDVERWVWRFGSLPGMHTCMGVRMMAHVGVFRKCVLGGS